MQGLPIKQKTLKGLIAPQLSFYSTRLTKASITRLKVAKRIGYGSKNDEYFSLSVRYSALPSTKTALSGVRPVDVAEHKKVLRNL